VLGRPSLSSRVPVPASSASSKYNKLSTNKQTINSHACNHYLMTNPRSSKKAGHGQTHSVPLDDCLMPRHPHTASGQRPHPRPPSAPRGSMDELVWLAEGDGGCGVCARRLRVMQCIAAHLLIHLDVVQSLVMSCFPSFLSCLRGWANCFYRLSLSLISYLLCPLLVSTQLLTGA
jgi:hypothetical protein